MKIHRKLFMYILYSKFELNMLELIKLILTDKLMG